MPTFPKIELTIARRSQPPRRTSTRKARSCPHTRGQIAHKNEPVVTSKRPSGRPLLTDSAPPVEFVLTHSEQTTKKILTEARTHIRIFKFWSFTTQIPAQLIQHRRTTKVSRKTPPQGHRAAPAVDTVPSPRTRKRHTVSRDSTRLAPRDILLLCGVRMAESPEVDRMVGGVKASQSCCKKNSLRGISMNTFDNLLQRNKEFAAKQSAAGTLIPSLSQAMPKVKAIIIGCADMRTDPAHVLGIQPGEAVVLRDIGGRITPGLLQQLALLGRIGQLAGEVPGGGGEFHMIVLQHTDCGITRLAGDPAMLAPYFQIAESELKTKAVSDPRAAVAADVAALRAVPALPGAWLLSGLVYNVATGLVEVVVPPAPIRTA